MTTAPKSIPDLWGLPATHKNLALLNEVARNHVWCQPGRNGVRTADWVETSNGGCRQVTEEISALAVAGWVTRPNIDAATKRRVYWTPSRRGWRIRQYHGHGVMPFAVSQRIPTRVKLIPDFDRTIPEWPARQPGQWDGITYRAAVFCESAAAIARRRPLRAACCGNGMSRHCQADAQSLGLDPTTEATWPLCVYCALADAREDFQTGYPKCAPADLCLSMTAAFEVVEEAGLHREPPFDLQDAAEKLMTIARQLHHAALSPAVLAG